jgi:hypothetical protein
MQKNDKIKISLIPIKSRLNKMKSLQIPKNINSNKIKLQKNPLLESLKNKENIENDFKTLKKSNSLFYNSKNKLPLLNNNNYNSINNISNSKISFTPISNNHSTLNKAISSKLLGSKSVKAFKKNPIKIQFFSKVKELGSQNLKNNSNMLRGLVSPKYSNLRNEKNLLYSPKSETRDLTNDENSKIHNLSNNNIDKEKFHLKRRINKFKRFGFSEFYKISKNSDVSARSIYKHYILEEMKDETPDMSNNFTKYVLKKYKSPQIKLNHLYGINEDNLRRIREIKNNNAIALKSDFNVKEYQNILCGMIKKRCDNDSIIYLKKKYEKFNEEVRNYKRNFKYKGRYTKLADKIRKNAPSYLINRLKQLDEENLISKAKYFHVDLSKNQEEKI